jgi:hypothetical protein
MEDGKEVSVHAGSDGTFFCYAQIDRETDVGYILMVNSGSESAPMCISEMIKAMNKIP